MPQGRSELSPVTSPALEHPGVRHGFFTRPGGVSQGIYEGLNVGLGSSDDPEAVMENRAIAADWLGTAAQNLLTVYQVHSCDVVIATGPFGDERPQVDAIVTSTPGLAIGILTADCGPVLFLDPQARVAGAAHAGWKGATGGILEATVSAMEELGANRTNIQAVLGPMISQENYEVGPEFVERLTLLDPQNGKWLAPSANEGHAMFDLPGYILNRLGEAGVSACWTGQCTYEEEGLFYSYRLKTHRAEPDYGRQLSAICLE